MLTSSHPDEEVEQVYEDIDNIVNTVLKKLCNRCWTWISPNVETKNEIDYILTDKHGIFSDLSVLNSINIGSDHRMV